MSRAGARARLPPRWVRSTAADPQRRRCGLGRITAHWRHDAQHVLLHRRPHLRQSGASGGGRRAAARRRLDERAPPGFPRALRLDPHRADVRAARPRRHVRRDPVPAVPRRLRHRRPVHRGERLPADVRPRHDRHGDLRARAGAGQPARGGPAAPRYAGRPGGRRLRARGPVRRARAPDQRAELSRPGGGPGRLPGTGRAGRGHRLRRQFLRDRRPAAELRRARPAVRGRHPAPEPGAAPAASTSRSRWCIRRTRPSARSRT